MGVHIRGNHRCLSSFSFRHFRCAQLFSPFLNPGPYCAGIFDPRSWASSQTISDNLITLEFTRVVLAIGVFAIGVELPKAYMKKHWKSLFFLLVPVMTWVGPYSFSFKCWTGRANVTCL